ncbi:MAG: hypothetical protein V7L02_13735 [Nostoc sp.]
MDDYQGNSAQKIVKSRGLIFVNTSDFLLTIATEKERLNSK